MIDRSQTSNLGTPEEFEVAQSVVEAHFYALRDEIEQLRVENESLRNLAANLRPGPISQALQDSPDYSGQTIERLRAALERYGRHSHPNCHDLTLKADGSFGPRNGCLCGLDTALSGDEPVHETSMNDLTHLYDVFQIGSAARNLPTLLANVQNVARRSDCLSAIEREFFTLTDTNDEGEEDEHCPLSWGADPKEYVEQFRAALEGAPAQEISATPAAVLQWAEDSFGPIARNRDERAARLVEEAMEVAQAEGVSLDIIKRIADRVYSRPLGELGQEVGGLGITLYALTANCGIDLFHEIDREWRRVLSKPRDWWQRKHAEKVEAGTANLSPVETGACPPFDAKLNASIEAVAKVLQEEAASDPNFPVRGLANYAAAAGRIIRAVAGSSEKASDDYAPVTELTDYPRNEREQP